MNELKEWIDKTQDESRDEEIVDRWTDLMSIEDLEE